MVTKKIDECQSVRISIILEHLSIRRLLKHQFLKAWIDAFSLTNTRRERVIGPTQFEATTVPIYRLKHQTRIVYRCSLALRLTTQLQLSPMAIAQRLITHLTAFMPISQNQAINQSILEFNLELREKGVIDCILSDRSLVVWLEQFHKMFLSTFTSLEETKRQPSLNLFPIQYTHARCCALLRLGDFDGLIEFNTQQLDQLRWSWKAPNPIPWLKLHENYEYHLIGQIFNLVDELEEFTPNHSIILATQLSEAFWKLERYCRIWGEVKQKTPLLAQARLGLVAVTQLLLRWLLQEKLKVTVFIEI